MLFVQIAAISMVNGAPLVQLLLVSCTRSDSQTSFVVFSEYGDGGLLDEHVLHLPTLIP